MSYFLLPLKNWISLSLLLIKLVCDISPPSYINSHSHPLLTSFKCFSHVWCISSLNGWGRNRVDKQNYSIHCKITFLMEKIWKEKKEAMLSVTVLYCFPHCFKREIYQSRKQKPLCMFQAIRNSRQKLGVYKTFGRARGEVTSRSQVCCF